MKSIVLIGADGLVRDMGGDPDAMARQVGLPSEAFSNPDMVVPVRAVGDFLERAASDLNCPQFGLLLSQRQSLAVLGPLFVMINFAAATVADAVTLLSRHLHAHSTALHLTVRPTDDGLLLEYDVSFREQIGDRQAVELGFGLITSFVRNHHAADWMPVFVQLRHQRPASILVHQRLLGTNLYFEQDRNALCIDPAALSRPIGMAPPQARRTAARLLTAQQRIAGTDIVAQVETTVRALMQGQSGCSAPQVAQMLGLSTRSLQRQLEERETRFEEIRDGVRADLAAKYLRQTSMPVAEIAAVLGYSQSSPFTRFFRRHYGVAPLEYRRGAQVVAESLTD